MIKAHFLKADTGNDKSIDFTEIDAFLESMNLKLKKEQINTLLNVSFVTSYVANNFYHYTSVYFIFIF